MNLSEHFTLEELTHTDHRELDNTPNDAEVANLNRLASFLEEVKTVLGGKPVMVKPNWLPGMPMLPVGTVGFHSAVGCVSSIGSQPMVPGR